MGNGAELSSEEEEEEDEMKEDQTSSSLTPEMKLFIRLIRKLIRL